MNLGLIELVVMFGIILVLAGIELRSVRRNMNVDKRSTDNATGRRETPP